MSELIKKTEDFVIKSLSDAEGGHDHHHVFHVRRLGVTIGKAEGGVDMEIVECGSLLHDIADSKFHDGDEEIGPKIAYDFLIEIGATEEFAEHVANIVRYISFKGSLEGQQWMSPELAVVQDADRLTAIGAIGIARTFNYGGSKGRKIYDPDIPPKTSLTKEEYKASTDPTINHFYEKLLLLKDLMNTEKGREMAEARHAVMESFLQQFYQEWEGTV